MKGTLLNAASSGFAINRELFRKKFSVFWMSYGEK